jgi:hypothetical protein
MSMLRSVQQNMPNMPNEYNYKMPMVASQSKIVPSNAGVPYKGPQPRKFIVNHPNQLQMVSEIQQRNNGMVQNR